MRTLEELIQNNKEKTLQAFRPEDFEKEKLALEVERLYYIDLGFGYILARFPHLVNNEVYNDAKTLDELEILGKGEEMIAKCSRLKEEAALLRCGKGMMARV